MASTGVHSSAPASAGPAATNLSDAYGRRIEYMRLSLTDRCNFRCIYCMPQEGVPFIDHQRIINYEELLRLCGLFTSLGITRYKITGGEPLCRKGAVEFMGMLSGLAGVEEITLTTNGALLRPHLEALRQCGINTITFSCDSLEQAVASRMAGAEVDINAILRTMEEAAHRGMKVKINTLPLQGCNEAGLVDLARWALERGYHIRFIEAMPIGLATGCRGVPMAALAKEMAQAFGPLLPVDYKTGNGPARMYSVTAYPGLIGFIAALSDCFCAACNRIRLTSTGFLKTCLSSEAGVDLKQALRDKASDQELRQLIINAVKTKPAGHNFAKALKEGGRFSMNTIGG